MAMFCSSEGVNFSALPISFHFGAMSSITYSLCVFPLASLYLKHVRSPSLTVSPNVRGSQSVLYTMVSCLPSLPMDWLLIAAATGGCC